MGEHGQQERVMIFKASVGLLDYVGEKTALLESKEELPPKATVHSGKTAALIRSFSRTSNYVARGSQYPCPPRALLASAEMP